MSGNEVFNKENPTIPINVGCDFDLILNNEQRNLCRAYGDKMLSTIAIGTLQALNQCQKLFKDSPWNCSVFADSKTHYLGRFAEIGEHHYLILLIAIYIYNSYSELHAYFVCVTVINLQEHVRQLFLMRLSVRGWLGKLQESVKNKNYHHVIVTSQ